MKQTAALFFKNRYYLSHYSPLPFEPQSATTQLIQGIYESFPDQAIAMLRARILMDYQPSLLCRGMISVAAKRYSVDLNLNQKISESLTDPIEISYAVKNDGVVNFEESFLCAGKSWIQFKDKSFERDNHSRPRHQESRLVRSLLLDENLKIQMGAENRNSKNKTKHAEIQLLQNYFAKNKKGFDKRNVLVTSLQCCKMCAAMIWHMQMEPLNNLEVYFFEEETGSSARDTILTAGGNLRRELFSAASDYKKVVEQRLGDFEF